MIPVRNSFQLKFGKAREAKDLIKEYDAHVRQHGNFPTRLLTDLTGPHDTFFEKMTFESLAALEQSQSETMGSREFSDWYQKLVPLVDSRHSESYSILS